MKQLFSKLMVFDGDEPHMIRVYTRSEGARYEIRLDREFWATCESGNEVNDEIANIISMYQYRYFPTI